MNNVPPETEKAPASPAVTAPTIAVPVSRDAVRMPLADDQRRDLSREYSTSPTSSAAPGDSPFYNRVFWASYKGLSRGLLGGLLLGAVLGAGVGALVAGGLALSGIAMGGLAVSAIVGATALVGMKYYKDTFSIVGANAGAISAAMEINEERSDVINQKLDKLLELEVRRSRLDPNELEELQKDARLTRHRGMQYFEDKFSGTPPIFWGLLALGAVAGAIFGGVLLWGGSNFLNSALSSLGLGASASPTAGAALLAASTLGGATFGINRHYFRQHFNVTNALYEGDLRYVGKQRDQEKQNIADICDSPGRGNCDALEKDTHKHAANPLPGTRVGQARFEGGMQASPQVTRPSL